MPFGSKGYHAVFNFLQGGGGYQVKSAVISVASIFCGYAVAACNGGGQAGLAKAYGASDRDAFNTGGQAALTSGLFQAAGAVSGSYGPNSPVTYLAHAGAGCVSAAAVGNCGQGAASAVFGKFTTNVIGNTPGHFDAYGFAATAVAGGVGSVIGGGKFENGAKTAAYGYLFNNLTTTQKPLDVGKTSSMLDKISEFFNYKENYDAGYKEGAAFKQQLADNDATMQARIDKNPDSRTTQESASGYKTFGTFSGNVLTHAVEASGDRNFVKTIPFVRGYVSGVIDCLCKGVPRE